LILFIILLPIMYSIWALSPIFFLYRFISLIVFWSLFIIYFLSILMLWNFESFNNNINRNNRRNRDKRRTSDILIAIFAVLVYIFGFASLTVGWSEETIFMSKKNPDMMIVHRCFGGGAWDSSPSECKIKKITQFIYIFKIINDIDTNKINKDEWIRNEKYYR